MPHLRDLAEYDSIYEKFRELQNDLNVKSEESDCFEGEGT
jgi:hypothetical protein